MDYNPAETQLPSLHARFSARRPGGRGRWHRALEGNRYHGSQGYHHDGWDKSNHPLWPHEFGGNAWADGSGTVRDSSPRPPKGVRRLKRHQDALARFLSTTPEATRTPTKHPQSFRGLIPVSSEKLLLE